MKLFRATILIFLGILSVSTILLLVKDLNNELGEGDWIVIGTILIWVTILFHFLFIVYFFLEFKTSKGYYYVGLVLLGYTMMLVFFAHISEMNLFLKSDFFILELVYLLIGGYLILQKN